MCIRVAVEESSCSNAARSKSSMFSTAVFSTSSASQKSYNGVSNEVIDIHYGAEDWE